MSSALQPSRSCRRIMLGCKRIMLKAPVSTSDSVIEDDSTQQVAER